MSKLAFGLSIDHHVHTSAMEPEGDLISSTLRVTILPPPAPSVIGASVFKPFLSLLDQNTPSSVKLGESSS